MSDQRTIFCFPDRFDLLTQMCFEPRLSANGKAKNILYNGVKANKMTFKNVYDLSDILSAISIVLVIIGGVFAYYQWRKSVSLKRASYINDLTEKIRSDPDIKDCVYLFDYDANWYSAQFHGDTALELKVDKTLSCFSYICYLKKQNIISKQEFKFF